MGALKSKLNLCDYSMYLCAVNSSAVLMGMSVPNAEAISRGPSVHFVSPAAIPGPTWAIRRGSSTTDKGLSEGTFLRTGVRLNRGLATKAAEREGFSLHRGGKVTSGEWSFFLTLDPGLVMSLPQVWEAPSWDFSFEGAANMLLISLWIPSAGLGTTNFVLPVYKRTSLWNIWKKKNKKVNANL